MKAQPLIEAFLHAGNGIAGFFKTDRNGKIHLTAAVLVFMAGWYFAISVTEWCLLLLCIGLVIALEMLNYALERVCNMIHTEWHPVIKAVKDVAAGAVLWSAIISAVIGLLIFIPKIRLLLCV